MSDVTTINADTAEAARADAANAGGQVLVLAPETFQQIEDAEAAGGFEGGQSGASGEGGFSAPGTAPNSSSASDPPPSLAGIDDPSPVGVLIEEATEKIMDLKDVWEAFKGVPLGPVILVPKRELLRLVNGDSPDSA